jgi:hypothetical protein
MKIYRYWAVEKQNTLIDGRQQSITCYGGSNNFVKEARIRAKEKAGTSTFVNKFMEQVGAIHSATAMVQLHDEITGISFRQPLA